MAFGVAGAAAGGNKALEDIVAQRLFVQKLEAEIANRQKLTDIEGAQLNQRAVEHSDNVKARQRDDDRMDADRRDRNNDRQLDIMNRDRAGMDTDAALEGLPEHMKGMGPLIKVGAMGKISPTDLQDPKARRQNEMDSIREEAEIRGSVGAKYRAPREGRKSIQQVVGPDNQVQLVSVDLDTGESTPIQMPPGMAPNKPPKPITGAERQAVSYFNRMLEAERNARSVEGKLKGVDLGAAEAAPDFLENWLKSNEGQLYTQAQRTFTEGRLRKESGAAVPPGEYDNDRRTNFRIANDHPDTVKQKRGSRVATMRGIGNSAGRALQEFYGQDANIDSILAEFAEQEQEGAPPQQKPIPNIPGGIAEFRDGKWIRVK
jgi:hypothetical protein